MTRATASDRLDRQGTTPLYLQLREAILDEVTRSKMAPGDKLPAEREIQERFRVSRATVRSALDLLERQGYVVRTHGVGTVLARAKIQPNISHLTSFTEDLKAKGLKPGSATLDVNLVRPPAIAAEDLKLSEVDKVWFVRRLRFADGEPIGIHNLYIPPRFEFAPEALQSMSSFYALLSEKHGIEPFRAVERFTAIPASADQASLLSVKEGAALLSIQRTTYDFQERAIEYVDLVYRADRYEYRVELLRKG